MRRFRGLLSVAVAIALAFIYCVWMWLDLSAKSGNGGGGAAAPLSTLQRGGEGHDSEYAVTLPPGLRPSVTTTTTTTPSSSSPTTLPRVAAQDDDDDDLKACLALPPPKSTRIAPDWQQCTGRSGSDGVTMASATNSTIAAAVFSMPVVMLQGYEWGQFCNGIGIISGVLRTVREMPHEYNMSSTLVALSPVFAKTAWMLDFYALSSTVGGLLLDCNSCDTKATLAMLPKQVRCSSLVIRGKVYDVSQQQHVFTIQRGLPVVSMFHVKRPKALGYMAEFNTVIQPPRELKWMVERAMQQRVLLPAAANGHVTVGIHQRYMDGMAFKWLQSRPQYNCSPRANFSQPIAALAAEFHRVKRPDFWNLTDARYLWRVVATDEERSEVERRHPLLITGNYSFSQTQIDVLGEAWPALFTTSVTGGRSSSTVDVLLASDGQTPAAELVLRSSKAFAKVHTLKDNNDDDDASLRTCLARWPHLGMLADMIALSMTDVHFANPLSSCDDIVVHWRRARGKQRGTSHPRECYDGFFN